MASVPTYPRGELGGSRRVPSFPPAPPPRRNLSAERVSSPPQLTSTRLIFRRRDGPANVAPWLEQVGDGLAKRVTLGLDAEISEVADCHQAAQERPEGAAQPDPVAGGDRRVTQDPAELLLYLLVVAVAVVSFDAQA
jgi:hypothetical protein